jgi:hypothetical protein
MSQTVGPSIVPLRHPVRVAARIRGRRQRLHPGGESGVFRAAHVFRVGP